MVFNNGQPVSMLGHALSVESFSEKTKEVEKKLSQFDVTAHVPNYRSMQDYTLDYAQALVKN